MHREVQGYSHQNSSVLKVLGYLVIFMHLAECWQYCWGSKCSGLDSHLTKSCTRSP